jgi:hypothetical protein
MESASLLGGNPIVLEEQGEEIVEFEIAESCFDGCGAQSFSSGCSEQGSPPTDPRGRELPEKAGMGTARGSRLHIQSRRRVEELAASETTRVDWGRLTVTLTIVAAAALVCTGAHWYLVRGEQKAFSSQVCESLRWIG